jgi:hypothetical protein
MKTLSNPAIALALACFTSTSSRLVQAQSWTPMGPAAITTNYVFATAGGISYFTHTSHTLSCARVYSGTAMVSGTNLWAIVEREHWTGDCVAPIPDLGHDETHTIVLGALVPGDYVLALYAYQPPYFTQLGQYRLFTFSVPEPVVPTVQATIVDTNLNLSIQGVSNAVYAVQSTTDLSNWSTISSQTNAPFEWSEPVDTEAFQRFYRVQITGQ